MILICVELILKPTIIIHPHAQVYKYTKPFEILAQPILGLKMVGKHLQMAGDWPRIVCVSEVPPRGETKTASGQTSGEFLELGNGLGESPRQTCGE